jgi:hypothetical protein
MHKPLSLLVCIFRALLHSQTAILFGHASVINGRYEIFFRFTWVLLVLYHREFTSLRYHQSDIFLQCTISFLL